ncbi:hypothetical protein Tco_0397236 [Tanacetum coccineum]
MSFSKRPRNDAVCYIKPLDSLKSWNDHFFWVDAFACPASFPWNSSKSVSKDPFPQSSEFNTKHYATLVAYPAPFHKYPEPFLCLMGIKRHYTLDENTYPEFLRDDDEGGCLIGERQRDEDEPRLLETTVGRVVPLLPVAPTRTSGELEASVDKLFDEGVVVSRRNKEIPPVVGMGKVLIFNRKRKTAAVDAGGPSHPPKKLREDHGTLGRPFVAEREGGDHIDSVTGLNLRTISAPQRFVISSDSSHHSGVNIAEAEVDSFVRPSVPVVTAATSVASTADAAVVSKEQVVKPSIFSADSASAGGTDPAMGGFTDLTGSDLLVGSIRTVMALSAKVRMRVEYNIKERRRLNSIVEEKNSLLKAKDEEVESLKAQLLVKEAEAAEAVRLRAEASKFEVIEKSPRDEAQAFKERSIILEKEKSELEVKVTDLAALVKVKEQEVAELDAMVTSVKLQNDNLADQMHKLEASSVGLQEKVTVYEECMSHLEKFQDEKMKEVNEKFDKLIADFVEMALHLEEKFYPHLLITISRRRWLLTHSMELALAKCLNSTEYLSALGAAIGKAVEKGMQEGLSAGITHGAEGRKLTDVAAYNPSTEDDYLSALQRLQSVNFSLIAELRANKDASVDTIMNLLCLEDTLAERLGLAGSSQVRKIKENIANHVSALRDIFVLLSEPLSAVALEGTVGTSDAAPCTADTTTALSIVSSASTVRPISIDDYEVISADNQATVDRNVADEDANHFPNVDDAELNVPK